MKAFNFARPETIGEAIQMLISSESTRLLAGGTDLLVEMKAGINCPTNVVSLTSISGMDYVRKEQYTDKAGDEVGKISIGALTKIRTLEQSPVIEENLPALHDAAANVAAVQIRNLATIGGNVGRAAPSADLVPALIVYGAQVTVQGPAGIRTVLLEKFDKGPGKTDLQKGEIITEISVSPMCQKKSAYEKFGKRKAMEISVAGVAVCLDMDGDICKSCRIALGSVGPTVFRACAAEAILNGSRINDEVIRAAAESAKNEARPITDIRASEEYRREIIAVLTEKMIAKALKR